MCSIFGRMREARDEVCDEAEVVHSARMVVLCAMQELQEEQISKRDAIAKRSALVSSVAAYYRRGVAGVEEDAILAAVRMFDVEVAVEVSFERCTGTRQ